MRHWIVRWIVLAAALAAVTGGSAQAAENVTIHRDAFGIPHVEAQTFAGLAYGTGYALALDRPFLLSAIRLTAQGRSAEMLGEGSLAADIVQRRDFYEEADARRQLDGLSAARRQELQSFADGVNAGWAKVRFDPQQRPTLWDAFGYDPPAWTPLDSVAVTSLFTYSTFAGEGGAGQLRNGALLARLEERYGKVRGLAMWKDLLWKNDPRAPSVVPKGEGTPPRRSYTTEHPSRAQLDLAVKYAGTLGRAAVRRAAEAGLVKRALEKLPIPRIGSYAAAVSGARTRSGGAVTIGSPQAGFTAPSVFWQVGQHMPGRDCTGFTVPGLGPWLGVGWCNRHAWSLVAGNAGEQVDHYLERVEPGADRRYRYRGEIREMRVRRESFKVNGCAPPLCATASDRTEVREFEETVHGVVVDRDRDRHVAITQRRAQKGIWARSLEAVAGWNSAGSVAEFDAATDKANGSYNVVYGDADGNIMYRFSGVQPVRADGYDRRLPSPGSGVAEWRGMLPQRAMPRVVNPRSGILVANQGIESKPASWWPNASAINIGRASRVPSNRRILAGATSLDVAGMQALNPNLLEGVDPMAPLFERSLRLALRGADDPRLREALGRLESWAAAGYPRRDADGDGRYDDPAIAIFGADDINLPTKRYLWRDLLDRVFGDELGEERVSSDKVTTYQAPGPFLGQLSTLRLALERSARRRARASDKRTLRLQTDFVDDRRTKRRERAGELIRASVATALRQLEAQYGTADMSQWLVSKQTLPFAALGAVSVAPLTRSYDHGTYSQIVDARAGDGQYILPPGNQAADSAPRIAAATLGSPPPHFDDQRELYERYEFVPMRNASGAWREQTESSQVLQAP